MGKHAMLSPSSADRWMQCPGSVAMASLVPYVDDTNEYSAEGTAAHFLASEAMTQAVAPDTLIGNTISVTKDGAAWGEHPDALYAFEVDEDMARYVTRYINDVKAHTNGADILVEQAIPIGHLTGEPDAVGTADAIVLNGVELQVHDLKYGMKYVSAQDNRQLKLYALGALDEYSCVADIETVRLFIHQPRVTDKPGEFSLTVAELNEFRHEVEEAALYAMTVLNDVPREQWAEHLVPGDVQCRHCPAKPECPALQRAVENAVQADFENLDEVEQAVHDVALLTPEQLAQKMAATDLVEQWIKAVRARVEANLLSRETVPGYKLVTGRQGPRKWVDASSAEAELKRMRLKREEMYTFKVKSPAQIEKQMAEKYPRRWEKLQQLVTQSPGKPHVTTEDDPRPVLELASADDFTDLNKE